MEKVFALVGVAAVFLVAYVYVSGNYTYTTNDSLDNLPKGGRTFLVEEIPYSDFNTNEVSISDVPYWMQSVQTYDVNFDNTPQLQVVQRYSQYPFDTKFKVG